MRLAFTLTDVQEISTTAVRAFVSTFHYKSDELDDSSSSDLEDFDPSTYGCGEITESVETMVETYSKNCSPLKEIYGSTESEIIKKTIMTASEETQCAGLKFFNDMTPGEDRNLITSCITVCYWCCCNGIKKVSPIIAEATANLLN
jgi:hypothetical protein